MLSILVDYLDRLTDVHRDLNAALRDLPVEALDWSPGPEINSLAVLAAHAAGSERYWIGDVAGGEPSNRDRAAEFKTAGVESEMLIVRLEASFAHSQSVLKRLTLADLEKVTSVKHGDRMVTGAWALQHALEHVSVHLGHMQIVRQLWDQAHA